MSFVVFLGPTLDRVAALRELDARYLPPASQGDVYLAARDRPWGIGIVDGYFKHAPAVWHKEILWALSRGVHVFGAASMGALRAAELSDFGMRGVGAIFEDYAAGTLQDDDEVTIVHGDADGGYRAMSDALVNIRATLAAALHRDIIDADLRDRLLRVAKDTFYEERSYARLLSDARRSGADAREVERLQAWLPEGVVDQKRQDAVAMLRAMRAAWDQHPGPCDPRFRFQHTDAWEQVRRQIHLKPLRDSPAAAYVQGDAAINELRLRGEEFVAARDDAFRHALSQELAQTNGESVDTSLVPGALNDFRLRHGLHDPASVGPWLASQGLDLDDLSRLLVEELTSHRQRALFDAEVERVLVDRLRMSGRFRALRDRAEHKQRVLSALGLVNPDLGCVGIDRDELWRWFFVEHLGLRTRPEPDAYARLLGCSTPALLREVLRERLYQQHAAEHGERTQAEDRLADHD